MVPSTTSFHPSIENIQLHGFVKHMVPSKHMVSSNHMVSSKHMVTSKHMVPSEHMVPATLSIKPHGPSKLEAS